MATVGSILTNLTTPTLQPLVDYYGADASNFMKNLMKSSKGVWMNPEIGRDWKVTRTFALGMGGAVEMAGITGPDVANVGSAVGYQVLQKVETWPGMGEAVMPSYAQKELTLRKMKVSIYIPSLVLKLIQLRAHIGNHFDAVLKGTAKNIGYMRNNLFLAGARNEIGSFTVPGGGGNISSTGYQVTLASGGAIGRFNSGQRWDIFPNGSNARQNTVPVFSDNVDPFGTSASPVETGGGYVKLYHTGGDVTALAAGTYDLVPRNSGRELAVWPAVSARVPTTFNSMFVDTGALPYGIGTAENFPIFKSMVRTLGGKVMTTAHLLKFVGHYQDARPGMDGIDSLWARPGVWASHFNASNAEFNIERNGQIVSLKDGQAVGAGFSLGGYALPYKSDSALTDNTVYGTKSRNNWTLIVPPRYKNAGSSAEIDGAIEFMWPVMSGGREIFTGYRKVGGADAGAFTDAMEAHGEHWFEVASENIPGLKITDVHSLYG